MMTKPRLLTIAALGLAVVAVSAWFGWSLFGPDITSGSQSRLRFVNVSIAQPPPPIDHSGLIAYAQFLPPESSQKPGGGPVIVLSAPALKQNIMIDARTGEVLNDTIGAQYRGQADAVIASIRVESAPAEVWPIADVSPAGTPMTHGSISFIQPDPASGIFVSPALGWGPPGVGGPFLFVHNGRSRMTVHGETGEISEDRILPEDREAFERFAASVTPEQA